jgi:hypothetical protein
LETKESKSRVHQRNGKCSFFLPAPAVGIRDAAGMHGGGVPHVGHKGWQSVDPTKKFIVIARKPTYERTAAPNLVYAAYVTGNDKVSTLKLT